MDIDLNCAMDRTGRDRRLSGNEKRFLELVAVWTRKLPRKCAYLDPLQVQTPMENRFVQASARSQRVRDLKKQRSCGFPPDEVRVWRPIEIPDPYSDHILTDDTYRPCVAQSKRGASL